MGELTKAEVLALMEEWKALEAKRAARREKWRQTFLANHVRCAWCGRYLPWKRTRPDQAVMHYACVERVRAKYRWETAGRLLEGGEYPGKLPASEVYE